MQEDKFEFRSKENQKAGKEESDEGVHEEYVYNSNKYISGAKRVQDGTVPMNILEFQYPFICSDYRHLFLFKSYCSDGRTIFRRVQCEFIYESALHTSCNITTSLQDFNFFQLIAFFDKHSSICFLSYYE